jgi:cytochrome c-type biogenesis protein CcmH
MAEVERLIPKIEARLAQSPNEAEGWRLLGWAHFQTGRFKEAASAYRRAVALAPNAPGQQSAYGEALVQAAGGLVTTEAAQAFEAARRLDPGDARARYFLGLLKAQRGDARGALDDWIEILRQSPPDAPWAGELREAIGQLAQQAGIDLANRLPSGPSADQMEAAAAMSPEDRQAMIRGMVDNLAARLAANPRDAEGWVRLMRARMVLGEPAAAAGALRDALAAFRDSPDQQQALREAARSLQVPEA